MAGASKRDLCSWVSKVLGIRMYEINDMAKGWHFVQLIDSVRREAPLIKLTKVHWDPVSEEQRLANLKLMTNFFQNIGRAVPEKAIDIEKVAKGRVTDIHELVRWFKLWYDGEVTVAARGADPDASAYDAAAVRSAAQASRVAAVRLTGSIRKRTPAERAEADAASTLAMPPPPKPQQQQQQQQQQQLPPRRSGRRSLRGPRHSTAPAKRVREQGAPSSAPPSASMPTEGEREAACLSDCLSQQGTGENPAAAGVGDLCDSDGQYQQLLESLISGPVPEAEEDTWLQRPRESLGGPAGGSQTPAAKRRRLMERNAARAHLIANQHTPKSRATVGPRVQPRGRSRSPLPRVAGLSPPARAASTAAPPTPANRNQKSRNPFEEMGNARIREELREAKAKNKVLEEQNRNLEREKRELLARAKDAEERRSDTESRFSEAQQRMESAKRDMEKATAQLREREGLLARAEQVRRMLHNSLQELKGNIRVFARVRPAIKDEDADCEEAFEYPDLLDHRQLIVDQADGKMLTGEPRRKVTLFEFDRTFGPQATQEDVFAEVSSLVHSALDGYKVCIFAYGQTGSGKTHTMEGGQGADMGLIPRTVALLFHRSQEMAAIGWEFQLSARYIEIYNDTLRCLLGDTDNQGKVDIHHSADGLHTTVSNCQVVPVTDTPSVLKVLARAQKRRKTAATAMNDRSSRSHSVFSLLVEGYNQGTQQRMKSEINLVDLAGSERIKDTGAEGARLIESEHINKSLSHLGTLIMNLHQNSKNKAKDQSHQFRNSKLTWLLKTCLGGDCKTLMVVNASPSEQHRMETVNSLRFAVKVNNCQIGTAHRRVRTEAK